MGRVELLEYLATVDEITLMELLEITSSDLLDAFPDKITDRIDRLYAKAEEDT